MERGTVYFCKKCRGTLVLGRGALVVEPEPVELPRAASTESKPKKPTTTKKPTKGLGTKAGSTAALILEALADGERHTLAALVILTGRTEKQVRRYANRLKRAGVVVKTGNDASPVYQLV
jgi:hypothetical protein